MERKKLLQMVRFHKRLFLIEKIGVQANFETSINRPLNVICVTTVKLSPLAVAIAAIWSDFWFAKLPVTVVYMATMKVVSSSIPVMYYKATPIKHRLYTTSRPFPRLHKSIYHSLAVPLL